MKHKVMIVADANEAYVSRFLIYVKTHLESMPFDVRIFSQKEGLKQYLSTTKPAILIVTEIWAREIKADQAEAIIVLSDGNWNEKISFKVISRFMPVSDMVKIAIEFYTKTAPSSEDGCFLKRSLCMSGFYSPLGRCFKTALAMTYGRIQAEKHPVIYLSMDDLSGFSAFYGRQYRWDISDFLLYIKQKRPHQGAYLSSIVQKDHQLDYLPPPQLYPDAADIDVEDWMSLLDVLRRETLYEEIVLDPGRDIRGIKELLKACDRIYMPVLKDEYSCHRVDEFLSGLPRWSHSLEERIFQIDVSVLNQLSTENELGNESFSTYLESLVDPLIKAS